MPRGMVHFFLLMAAASFCFLAPRGAMKAGRAAEKGFEKEVVNSIGMRLVRIPNGKFQMGSPSRAKDRKDDEKHHEVEISRDFWLGMHEVTQGQFKEVMGYNPSYFSRDGTGREGTQYFTWKPSGGKAKVPAETSAFPVEEVSWDEAKEFCDKLTARAKEKQAGRRYRLPTEAEWEYACRGGAPSYQQFHFGDFLSVKQANFAADKEEVDKEDSLRRTCKVGSYVRNRFGLCDMHGNVSEWCGDWYSDEYYSKGEARDPSGPPDGLERVVRGGSWSSIRSVCRSACRISMKPSIRLHMVGFRVILIPVAK